MLCFPVLTDYLHLLEDMSAYARKLRHPHIINLFHCVKRQIHEVTMIELNTKIEIPVTIKVDEAETTESMVIKAKVCEQEVTFSNHNYLLVYQEP